MVRSDGRRLGSVTLRAFDQSRYSVESAFDQHSRSASSSLNVGIFLSAFIDSLLARKVQLSGAPFLDRNDCTAPIGATDNSRWEARRSRAHPPVKQASSRRSAPEGRQSFSA